MTIQYIIVFLILAGALGWIAYKLLFKKDEKSSGSCCGCSFSEKCSKTEKEHKLNTGKKGDGVSKS